MERKRFKFESNVAKHFKSESEDLCISGYNCKLFLDAEKYADQEMGAHLIPWMGITDLMIDRYDARGSLDDMSKFCLKPSFPYRPSPREEDIEDMCDTERYLDLDETSIATTNDLGMSNEDDNISVTNNNRYAAIPFDYNTQEEINRPTPEHFAKIKSLTRGNLNLNQRDVLQNKVTTTSMGNDSNDQSDFVPPPELQIPQNIATPSSERMHNIIVKTANHVLQNGNQLEIVIKTKQQFNSNFEFLHFEDKLNAYYKYIKMLIQNGLYKLPLLNEENTQTTDISNNNNTSASTQDTNTLLPTITTTPTSINTTTTTTTTSSTNTTTTTTTTTTNNNNDNDDNNNNGGKLKAERREKAKLFLEKLKENQKEDSKYISQEDNINREIHLKAYIDSTGIESSINTHYSMYPQIPESLNSSETIIPPPPDIQPLVDQVACQTARKGGEDLERKLKAENDINYDFLFPNNKYYNYYKLKKSLFLQFYHQSNPTANNTPSPERIDNDSPKPISFAISNKSNLGRELQPLVDLGHDSCDENDDNNPTELQGRRPPAISLMINKELDSANVQSDRRKRAAQFVKMFCNKKNNTETIKHKHKYNNNNNNNNKINFNGLENLKQYESDL